VAGKGTLYLDEVDTLSLRSQVKLLRFIQEKEYGRLVAMPCIGLCRMD